MTDQDANHSPTGAPPPAPAAGVPPAPAVPAAAQRPAACPWCGGAVSAADLSCPSCGAEVDLAALVTESGWVQLPGRKDMAKLQFGRSYFQIEGKFVPVADVALAAEDSVYFSHHVLLWKEPRVEVSAMSLRGGWKRLMAGMPLVMTQARGPGHIAFSHDAPGELIAIPLQTGQAVDVREGLFMVATGQVGYDWFDPRIWYAVGTGNDREVVYPAGWTMDRFGAATAPGLLILHAPGNVFVRRLERQQAVLIKPTALVFKDPAVSMHLHYEVPRGAPSLWSGAVKHVWLRLVGPGRVAVKSVSEPVEHEHRNFSDSSPATQQRW
jgi:uncharacterized protein (AIM24 family)